ncbi:hypothetical protein C8D97_10443 [Pleionea mediterranea]|uniref:Uncharacterized protein n=2 Tax=Pleionea mediterranea TaxID=523701 RepID=A0A316FXI0_9GAMM|nr:hypothetical protein C8D97_10443 [Pleionea mediterranea]
MPVTRLLIHQPFSIDRFHFFPPGELDLRALRPVPNKTLENEIARGNNQLDEQTLREICSSATGFDVEVLESNVLIVFLYQMNWHDFLSVHDHNDDIELIKLLSSKAEKALDIIRFNFCRLDLSDTLPGLAGSFLGSEEYLGAMLYTPEHHESYLIAGAAVECSIVIKGLGLEIDSPPTTQMPTPELGEVSLIASHGLSLLTDAMTASNETTKFIRLMTLLEFLASPDEYQIWKKLKGQIACHSANTKAEYLNISKRLKYFSSLVENGIQRGLRTLIVHHGKFLADIHPSQDDRKALFLEIQDYVSCVLQDMINNSTLTWQEYISRREFLKEKLGVS